MSLANRLRQNVDRCVTLDNVQFVLTASAGVAMMKESDNAMSLLARARQALALARRGGRNRVRSLHDADSTNGPDDGPEVA